MQWKIIVVLFFSLFFLHTYEVSADEWGDVEKKVERALSLTKQGEYDKANQYLEQLSKDFLRLRFSDESLEATHVQVLTSSYDEARRALLAPNMDKQKRVNDLLQFRLALDAVQSEHQPMWAQLEPVISTTFQELKAASNNNQTGLRLYYGEFRENYSLIYPSLVIDHSEQRLQRVNRSLEAMDVAIRTGGQVTWYDVDELEEEVMALFEDESEAPQHSLILISLAIGSMILFTLLYVAWRKYEAEKRSVIV